MALLFDQNLSTGSLRYQFLGQVVNLDLLFCTGFDMEIADLFQYSIFTQGPMNSLKVGTSDEL